MAVEEISSLLGGEEGDWTGLALVILSPLSVIRTWTGPYFVWAVAPVTVRVVGAADVVLGAEALLVFAGVAGTERDADALGEAEAEEGARFFSGVFDDEAEADGEWEED
ncbi:hypothetical protein [Streptomyces sp. NPDC048825]|uniref:hypothetical protein n=1 Tax=Streptomyces sp. NPDC048825 TaxID=3365592 RepID=UPI0037108BE2